MEIQNCFIKNLNMYCETLSKQKIQNFASKMSTSSTSDLIFRVNLKVLF